MPPNNVYPSLPQTDSFAHHHHRRIKLNDTTINEKTKDSAKRQVFYANKASPRDIPVEEQPLYQMTKYQMAIIQNQQKSNSLNRSGLGLSLHNMNNLNSLNERQLEKLRVSTELNF